MSAGRPVPRHLEAHGRSFLAAIQIVFSFSLALVGVLGNNELDQFLGTS